MWLYFHIQDLSSHSFIDSCRSDFPYLVALNILLGHTLLIIWVCVPLCNDPSMRSKGTAYCNSTSSVVDVGDWVHPAASGMHLGPVRGWGGRGGVSQMTMKAGLTVTFDSVLREEQSVEAVAAGATPDVLAVGSGMTAGVAALLAVTTVATVTPSAEAADVRSLRPLLGRSLLFFPCIFSRCGRLRWNVSGVTPAGGGWKRWYQGGLYPPGSPPPLLLPVQPLLLHRHLFLQHHQHQQIEKSGSLFQAPLVLLKKPPQSCYSWSSTLPLSRSLPLVRSLRLKSWTPHRPHA